MNFLNKTTSFLLVIGAISSIGISNGIWAVVVANIEKTFKIGNGYIGLILSLGIVLSLIVNSTTGHLLVSKGPVVVLRIGLLLWSAMLIFAQYSKSALLFSIFLICSTAGLGLVDVSVNILAAIRFENRVGLLIRFHALYNFAVGLGVAFAALGLYLKFSWQLIFLSEALFFIVIAMLPNKYKIKQSMQPERKFLSSIKQLKIDHLIGLALVLCFCTVVEGAVFNWSILYLRSILGISLLFGSFGVVISQILAGASRASVNKLTAKINARKLLLLATFMSAVGCGLEILTTSPLISLIGLGIGIVSVSLCWPTIMGEALLHSSTPELSLSGVTSGGYLGIVLGPSLIGGLSSLYGLRTALIAVVVSALLAFLIRSLMAPRYS
jgi:hypothetical protein